MHVKDHEAAFARKLLDMRAERYDRFGHELFDEYAWEMLLALFIADAEGRKLTGRGAIEESQASIAIGQRWLAHLRHRDLIRGGNADDLDGPVTLTDRTLHEMESYLAEASRKMES